MGFRADRVLAGLDEHGVSRRITVGRVPLLGVSAVLTVVMLAAASASVLLATPRLLPPILLGIGLVVLSVVLRPRLGSLRRALVGGWQLSAQDAPAVHALVERIADRTGAPQPNVIAVGLEWNAGVSVVGLRRTKVLRLGVALLLALEEQQLVAVIGHELGHLQYEDSFRRLPEQPARSVFGALAAMLAPPRKDAYDVGGAGILAMIFSLVQVVAGLLSWALWCAHLGMYPVAAAEDRRAEIRADLIAARAAGSRAALDAVDVLAMLPELRRLLYPM